MDKYYYTICYRDRLGHSNEDRYIVHAPSKRKARLALFSGMIFKKTVRWAFRYKRARIIYNVMDYHRSMEDFYNGEDSVYHNAHTLKWKDKINY